MNKMITEQELKDNGFRKYESDSYTKIKYAMNEPKRLIIEVDPETGDTVLIRQKCMQPDGKYLTYSIKGIGRVGNIKDLEGVEV